MNLVFDQLKKAFSARREVRAEAAQEVRLTVMVAADVAPATALAVRAALRPQNATGKLYVAAFGAPDGAYPAVNTLSDAAVILAGSRFDLTAELYRAHHAAGVPCCVVVTSDGGARDAARLAESGVSVCHLLPGDPSNVAAVLGGWLVEALPSLGPALGASFPCCRHARALCVTGEAARNNALVGALPFLNAADMPAMMATELAMALKLADTYGLELNEARLPEAACVAASSLGLRALARLAARRVPLPSVVLNTGVAALGTYAVGRALMAYYEHLSAAGAQEPRPAQIVTIEPVPRDEACTDPNAAARPAP